MAQKHSFIYLLVSEQNNIFKIGKADNTINRYETLKNKWGNFNLTNSYQIKCNENNIFKLEKTLHYIFKDFNIIPDYKYDGYTEWFDIKCYEDILNLLNNLKIINNDIIDIKQGIEIPKKKRNNIWKSLSAEEDKKNKQQRNLNANIQNANNLINTLNELKEHIVFFNKEQNLLVFQNANKNKIDFLSSFQDFNWARGGFNFITSTATEKEFTYLDLQFNYFEQENRLDYEEIIKPYKIIINFFNQLNYNKIETDINIGLNYKAKQSKLWNNFFENISFIK